MSVGIEGKAKGSIGSWIVVSEWVQVGERWSRKAVKCAKVDGKKVKDDTFYFLKNGELVEVTP